MALRYADAIARTGLAIPFYAWEGVHHPTGRYRPDHVELCLVTSGEGRRIAAFDDGSTRPFEMRLGDLYIFRPLDVQEVAAVPEVGMSVICVAFPFETWERFTLMSELDQRPFLLPDPPRIAVDLRDPDVLRPFRRALEAFRNRPTTISLVRFLAETIPWFADAARDVEEHKAPSWLWSAVTAMHEEVNLRAGVPRLTALSHVSHTHLWRNTRTYFGMSPSELVTDIRIAHASVLLASTGEAIATIASRCGFSSASEFSKAFKRHRQLSPRDYRVEARAR